MGKITDIFNKIFGTVYAKLTESNIKKVNAAFGTFIITLMGLLTPVINHYAFLWFNVLLAEFFAGAWVALMVFIGVIVVTIFGTTNTIKKGEAAEETADEDDTAEPADDTADADAGGTG